MKALELLIKKTGVAGLFLLLAAGCDGVPRLPDLIQSSVGRPEIQNVEYAYMSPYGYSSNEVRWSLLQAADWAFRLGDCNGVLLSVADGQPARGTVKAGETVVTVLSATGLPEGESSVAICVSADGVTDSNSFMVTVDSVPASVSVYFNSQPSTGSGILDDAAVQVRLECSDDDSGCVNILYTANGTLPNYAPLNGSLVEDQEVEFEISLEGESELLVTATDRAGNRTANVKKTVSISSQGFMFASSDAGLLFGSSHAPETFKTVPVGGFSTNLAWDQNNNLLAISSSDGLYFSGDNGDTWEHRGKETGLASLAITDVIFANNRIYVARSTGGPGQPAGGLSISIDGGNSFVNYSKLGGFDISALTKIGVSDNYIYFYSRDFLYRSDLDLNNVQSILPATATTDLMNFTFKGDRLLISGGASAWLSIDAGANWVKTPADFSGKVLKFVYAVADFENEQVYHLVSYEPDDAIDYVRTDFNFNNNVSLLTPAQLAQVGEPSFISFADGRMYVTSVSEGLGVYTAETGSYEFIARADMPFTLMLNVSSVQGQSYFFTDDGVYRSADFQTFNRLPVGNGLVSAQIDELQVQNGKLYAWLDDFDLNEKSRYIYYSLNNGVSFDPVGANYPGFTDQGLMDFKAHYNPDTTEETLYMLGDVHGLIMTGDLGQTYTTVSKAALNVGVLRFVCVFSGLSADTVVVAGSAGMTVSTDSGTNFSPATMGGLSGSNIDLMDCIETGGQQVIALMGNNSGYEFGVSTDLGETFTVTDDTDYSGQFSLAGELKFNLARDGSGAHILVLPATYQSFVFSASAPAAASELFVLNNSYNIYNAFSFYDESAGEAHTWLATQFGLMYNKNTSVGFASADRIYTFSDGLTTYQLKSMAYKP